MNILWITKISDIQSWKTSRIELSKSLRKRGHNVKLVIVKDIGEKKPNNNQNIIYFPTISHKLLSGLIFGLIITFYFPLIFRKKKIDVIIIDGTSVWLPFIATLKLLRIPLILDIRTIPTRKKNEISFNINLFLSKYIIDGLTTITPELKETIIKDYNFNSKKIGIWPSGVSTTDFIKIKNNSNSDIKKYYNEFVIIHHGSHGKSRGITNLIKSIAELDINLRKKTKLILVGIPKNRQKEFLDISNKIGVKEQIELISKVEYKKIPSYIQSSDIGIIPLSPEKKWWKVSAPLKTLEYLGMGKPIVATNIPFHRRIFEKCECGILIDSNNPKSLSDAIEYMYRDRKRLKEMGEKGRELVKKYYTWDKIAIELEKFLENILVAK